MPNISQITHDEKTRKTVNDNCARIVRAFGWAAGEGLVPITIQQSLALLEPLAAGRRLDVSEGEPGPIDHVNKVLGGPQLCTRPRSAGPYSRR